ncbi:Holliday junction branch migration protein RuvA [Weeksellaceae bacterium KMM 9713]|uniref:Holliday junction branch migration complex subunit RuvA n=1 Tax=Profundicola chukchiensis TaxID=2961959 RepID=A0A9X4RTZ0_9FLAO|nr:Holliday junction branch migration protein RuvA [Profundicola chukchiensis]MDG4945136.1 Holliday junction branch migration protein RuvA [Profundicola chukchiensis]MDG4950215.1 Holliday junction branch migration protein RuvA [Profundicola chukchiensis]
MIAQLRGRLIEIHPSHAIVDCGGVGYHVNISLTTYGKIQKEENVLFYTHHLVREDAQILYGFADKEERFVFEQLISVNGVGPASGMMMISTLNPGEIYHAIANEDAKTLQSVKGIGIKTAQRIIIDLKDKLAKLSDSEFISSSSENKIKFEALSALEVLGISKKQSEKIVQKLITDTPQITLEAVIKETLKKL